MKSDKQKKPAGKPGRVAEKKDNADPIAAETRESPSGKLPEDGNAGKDLDDKIDAINEASQTAIEAEKRNGHRYR